MRHDTQLWKSARQLWHQLIINGILMDPEWKLAFAKMYTRDYPDLMKDFITDDHEHSVRLSSRQAPVLILLSRGRQSVDQFLGGNVFSSTP